MKNIYLLGATGSIGTQTLDVIRQHPDKFRLVAFSAGRNIQLTQAIIEEFQPSYVSVISEEDAKKLSHLYPAIHFGFGSEGLITVATYDEVPGDEHFVLSAVMGSVGLLPTLKAIEMRRTIGIANKETLVTAGHLVMEKAKQYGVKLLPVDSEHSAIYQCLQGEDSRAVKKLIITASGGSFRDYTREMLQNVTREQALNHPNWSMGAKITIDSASMMNKGLEVIEAHWLFDMPYDRIETILHRQSIIHSMVEFEDGAVKAQLGVPDMRLPIQYAFSYPQRIRSSFDRLDFMKCNSLTFEAPDTKRFRNLALAYEALHQGGNMPCIVNAANEVVVASFLKDQISFLGMSDVIEKTMQRVPFIAAPTYEDYVSTDAETRRIAAEMVINGMK